MNREAFERLRAGLSTTFVNLPAEQVDGPMAAALEQIAESFGLERATLYELSETKTELTATASARDEAGPLPPIARADDPLRWTMLLERSGVIDATAAHREVWAASVPLTIGGEAIGALRVASTTTQLQWTDDLAAQLAALAEIFSNAVARKRAACALLASRADVTNEKRANRALASFGGRLIEGQERDRSRIARELDDDICQRLAVLSIELQQLNADSRGDLRARTEELSNRTADILTDVQALSHELHSSRLDYLGIEAAIRGFCIEFARQQEHASIEFTSSGVPTHLPADVSLCLFRVVQEGLRNAVKHSGVRHVEAQLHGTSKMVVLTIRDRGRGFEPDIATGGHGLGLISMRERASFVNGTILVTSKPGWGTEISMSIPIRASHDRRRKTPAATKHVYLIPSDSAPPDENNRSQGTSDKLQGVL